jgi:acetylornithine deacetylase
MSQLVDYIRRLVDIPSVTGSEHEVASFLEKDLRERGFSVTLQDVVDERKNVYALAPRFAAGRVLHPPRHRASFLPELRGRRVRLRRGSCDARGFSRRWCSRRRSRDQGIEDVGLLFVVGEEVDSVGALAANRLESRARYVVVGEPTESRMANGHKGGFKFRLTAKGRAAHSAYPHLGESAIEHLLDALAEIRAADWGRSDVLGPAPVNIGTLGGGLAANVLAPAAEAGLHPRRRPRGQVWKARRPGRDTRATSSSQSDAVFWNRPGYGSRPSRSERTSSP